MQLIVLAVLGSLACSLYGADGPAATTAGVVAKIQKQRQTADFRVSGRLAKVAGDGQRTAYQVSMLAKAQAEGVRIFCEVGDPAPARQRLLIDSRAGGKASVRVIRPGEAAPREVPFAGWAERLLDSDLSYEDLLENHFLWSRQSLAKPAKYGARECEVLRSEPGAGERSHYSSVTSWLDREILYPVKVEKVFKGTGTVKEFLYYGLRKSKGLWSASQIEVRTKGKPGSTFLIFTGGSAKANLTPKDLELRPFQK